MFKKRSIQFTNCQLIRADGIKQCDFWIDGNCVSGQLKQADIVIDCKKLYISPGYIDLQLNGGWGFNFSSSDEDINVAIKQVSKQLVKQGVTSYCPTIITSSAETYRKILPKIKRTIGGKENGATILGIHLEGPFINSKRKGAHPIELIRDQCRIDSITQLKECYGSLENVSIITVAPELCDSRIYDQLRQLDIVVSMGHTNASLKEAEQALQNNCNLITHLFNAMPQFHHRDPGIIGCLTSYLKDKSIQCDLNNNDIFVVNGYANGNHMENENKSDDKIKNNKQLYYGVICDNVHTHEASIRFAYRLNPTGFICVTDGVASMGLESNKKHMIGDLLIEIQGNRAIIAGTNTLCGSIVQLDQCVRNFQIATNCSIVEAIFTVTSNPAKAINLYPKKGSLVPNVSDADFLIMTKNLDILATFVNGELVSFDSKILSIIEDFDQLIN